MDPAKRTQLVRFIRRVLDRALEHNAELVSIKPHVILDRPGAHPFSLAFVNALRGLGWELRATEAWKITDGIRRRMELEDLIDMTLMGVTRSKLMQAAVNDRARDYLAEQLFQTLHKKRVVLARIRGERRAVRINR